MKIFILYTKKTKPSGIALMKGLKEYLPNHKIISGKIDKLSPINIDCVINYGYNKPINTTAVIINNPKSISKSSNKKRARLFMKEVGIDSPKVWRSAQEIPSNEFPVVGRPTYHKQGKDFYLCNSKQEAIKAEELNNNTELKLVQILTKKGNRVKRWRKVKVKGKPATHFIKFISNTREFRVHVASKKILNIKNIQLHDIGSIKLSEKINEEGTGNPTIKNHKNGWVFKYPEDRRSEDLSKVRELSKQALLSFNLHFGAVDVMLDQEGNVYILEINTCPGLTDETSNTLSKYCKAITKLLDIEDEAR